MKRHGVILAAFTILLLALLGSTQPAGAIVAGTNGRIVFSRLTCRSMCTFSLISATASDTDEHVLFGPVPPSAFDEHLIGNWSPDGRHVIFMARQKIWEVNADGTGRHVIFTPPNDGTGLDDGPAFTPDGNHIVFTRCCPE